MSVARALLYLDHSPRSAALLPDGAAEVTRALLARVGSSTSVAERMWRVAALRRIARRVENGIMAGFTLHLGLRKRFFDDQVKAAIAAGIEQIVILGAGFDSLAARLAPAFSRVSFIELDHPSTSALKQRALHGLALEADNLHLLARPLGGAPLVEALARCPAWRQQAPSCLLAEGLLMYLDQATARALFDGVGGLTAGSRLLSSYLTREPDGQLELGRWPRAKRALFSLLGEPLRWGVSRDGLDAELERSGLRRMSDACPVDLRARYLGPAGLAHLPLATAEKVCVAEVVTTSPRRAASPCRPAR